MLNNELTLLSSRSGRQETPAEEAVRDLVDAAAPVEPGNGAPPEPEKPVKPGKKA
jgi:hypothetical protein